MHRSALEEAVRTGEFDDMLEKMEKPDETGPEMARPHLLFTAADCSEVGRFFAIAGREP